MLRLTVFLTLLSIVAMVLIDRAMGPRAEFLNAWSVVERLMGREPSAGLSLVAQRLGAWGELVVVLAVNAAVGTLLALVARLLLGWLR
jgi:hypothetical protein